MITDILMFSFISAYSKVGNLKGHEWSSLLRLQNQANCESLLFVKCHCGHPPQKPLSPQNLRVYHNFEF